MNNIIERKWKQGGLVSIEDLRGMTFQDEELAHTFRIRGVDDSGAEMALSGTVGAVFLRSDNTDVVITGTITNGAAVITLPEECYDMPGRFGLTVFLTSDGQTVAIYAAIGSVSRTSSGNVSTGSAADVADLINRINAAVASIPLDYSALSQEVIDIRSALPSLYYDDAVLLSDGDDLDTLLYLTTNKQGCYRMRNGDAYINAPAEYGKGGGRLFVMSTQQNTRNLQIMIEGTTSPQVWMRYYNGTNWQSWARFDMGLKDVIGEVPSGTTVEGQIGAIQQSINGIPSVLKEGSMALKASYANALTDEDLDEVLTSGNYLVTTSTTAGTENHYPDGFTLGKIIVSESFNSVRLFQIAIKTAKNASKIWYRYYNGTTWDNWSDLSINQRDGELGECEWRLGYLSNGYPVEINDSDFTKRIVSDYIFVGKNTRIYIIDENHDFNLAIYDLNRVYKRNDPSDVVWARNTFESRVIPEDCYIRITMRKHDDSAIAENDIAGIVEKLHMEYYPPTAYNDARKDGIPDFYSDQLSAAVGTIRENMNACGQNGDTFAFITDLHWDPIIRYDNRNTRRSPMLMKKIVEETGIRKIVLGGDYFTGSGHKNYTDVTGEAFAMEQLRDVLQQFSIPNTMIFPIMGNHDRNRYTPNAADTASEAMGKYAWDYDAAYAMITKGCEDYGRITMGVDMAYYYDVPSCNTRYIFLNTHDQSGSGDGWIPNRSYSEGTQMYWFRETLNNTPGDYRIVVFQHIYFHIDENNLPVITNQGTQVGECCDEFNSGSTNNTKVVAIVCGHAHQDYKSETTGGIPVVMTDCDAYRVTLSGITSSRDTVNEQCFDVMTMDYANNKIKCVRIGRGGASANREYDLYTTT